MNTELQRENALLREALAIKNELDIMKQMRRRSKSSRKLSGSSLVGTPLRLPIVESKLDQWYNEDVDVSVSSTGSDIRRRLQETLDIHPQYSHVTPSRETPMAHDRTIVQHSFDIPQATFFAPTSFAQTSFARHETVFPSYANLMNETIHKLPPLFKSPLLATAPNTPMFSAWRIPEPVLFGLASKPHGSPSQYVSNIN